MVDRYISAEKSTAYNTVHTHNMCQKAFSENPNEARKKTQHANSLNMLAKSTKKICELGLQLLGAHLPYQVITGGRGGGSMGVFQFLVTS